MNAGMDKFLFLPYRHTVMILYMDCFPCIN